MKKAIKNNLPFIILAACIIVALIVGTFFDYEISAALSSLSKGSYFSNNFFAAFFEIFGETPVYIFPSIAICFVLIFFRESQKVKPLQILAVVICALVLVGLNYYAATRFIKASDPYFNLSSALTGVFKYVFCLFFSLTFSLVWYLVASAVAKNCSKENLKNLAICSLIVIFTAIICEATTHGLKPIFSRARYRFLFFLEENGLSMDGVGFTKWFISSPEKEIPENLAAAGITSDAFRSFPSGHSTSVGMVLSLTLLPFAIQKFDTKKYNILFYTLSFSISLIVMVSRIVAGAHYLSDVCMGFLITLITFLIVRAVVFKISRKTLFCK